MNILEKDIEELVYEAALFRPIDLFEKGLAIYSLRRKPVVLRQYNLGRYGVIDLILVSFDPLGNEFIIDIIELKKDGIEYSTLDQALRYKKGIDTLISEFHPGYEYIIRINLVGRSIGLKNSFCFIPDLFHHVSFFTYSLDMVDGLLFKEISNYNLSVKDVSPLNRAAIMKIKGMALSRHREL